MSTPLAARISSNATATTTATTATVVSSVAPEPNVSPMLARQLPLSASELSYVLLAAFPIPTEDVRYLCSLVLQSTYHYLVGDRSKYFRSYCRRPQPEEMWVWDEDIFRIAGPNECPLVIQLAAHQGVNLKDGRVVKGISVGGEIEAMYHDIVYKVVGWVLERWPDREEVVRTLSRTLQRALYNLHWAETPDLQYETAMTARALGVKYNTNPTLWRHNEGLEDVIAPYRPGILERARNRLRRAHKARKEEKARKRLEKILAPPKRKGRRY